MLLASAPGWLAATLLLLLLLSALEDLWRLQIEDWLSAGVAVGAFLALAIGGSVAGMWQNLILFALVLGIGTLLFVQGWMGGGDVKLLAACSLWFDLGQGWKMLVAVAIAGGLESLIVILLRLLPWSEKLRSRVAWLKKDEELPYGVAIAAGMIWMGLWVR
ncbi:MAG TPA: prepilin peptidase [Sphingomicrobium sp.]|nr:prepilin peptidase [Sphingomicrobium sp.]